MAEHAHTTPTSAARRRRDTPAPLSVIKSATARAKRRLAKLPPLQTRHMELLGVRKDGTLSVWSSGEVRPVSRFPRDGQSIKSGHYVIEFRDGAVTVHCSNLTDGRVHVMFMRSDLTDLYWPIGAVEPMLLGQVIPDPKVEAAILEGLQRLIAQQQAPAAPHKQRGKLGGS